jgi:hypothetical protein
MMPFLKKYVYTKQQTLIAKLLDVYGWRGKNTGYFWRGLV